MFNNNSVDLKIVSCLRLIIVNILSMFTIINNISPEIKELVDKCFCHLQENNQNRFPEKRILKYILLFSDCYCQLFLETTIKFQKATLVKLFQVYQCTTFPNLYIVATLYMRHLKHPLQQKQNSK